MSRVTGTAIVTVSVEVRGLGTYGPECSVGQVYEQSKREGVQALELLFQHAKTSGKFRVVGDPTIRTVITEQA